MDLPKERLFSLVLVWLSGNVAIQVPSTVQVLYAVLFGSNNIPSSNPKNKSINNGKLRRMREIKEESVRRLLLF